MSALDPALAWSPIAYRLFRVAVLVVVVVALAVLVAGFAGSGPANDLHGVSEWAVRTFQDEDPTS